MRFDSTLIEIAATPSYLLGVFFSLTLLFHILLVWAWQLSDIAWKKIDYIWLGAVALGLIAASGHADRYISEQLANNLERPRTAGAYNWLYSHIKSASGPDSGICTHRIRSEHSPPEFDQIVREQKLQCSHFETLINVMPAAVDVPFPSLVEIGYKNYEGDTNFDNFYVIEARRSAEAYEAQRLLYAERKISTEKSSLDGALTLLSPILLCFALALRITKVSGEVAIAKQKAAKPKSEDSDHASDGPAALGP